MKVCRSWVNRRRHSQKPTKIHARVEPRTSMEGALHAGTPDVMLRAATSTWAG